MSVGRSPFARCGTPHPSTCRRRVGHPLLHRSRLEGRGDHGSMGKTEYRVSVMLVDESIRNAHAVPVNARVTTVSVNWRSRNAARCTGLVPASSASKNAVPICTADAPASCTRRTAAAVPNPPAATTGQSKQATRADTRSSRGSSAGLASGSNVPPGAHPRQGPVPPPRPRQN